MLFFSCLSFLIFTFRHYRHIFEQFFRQQFLPIFLYIFQFSTDYFSTTIYSKNIITEFKREKEFFYVCDHLNTSDLKETLSYI